MCESKDGVMVNRHRFIPPESPHKTIRIPIEALNMLSTTRSMAEYDKLCGAIVRYIITGNVENVQKNIKVQYNALVCLCLNKERKRLKLE